jgi:ornithine cyclodeaminase
MLYINDTDFANISISWEDTIAVISEAVSCISKNDYSQPIKPYLRFKNPINRIIAMPAYAGGAINMAGIKWIASFPENINNNIPRASSITVLNNTNTGVPIAIFNTALISVIRTASVSGYILKEYDSFRQKPKYNVGIIGYGPIGRYHLKMCESILKDKISNIYLYDSRVINTPNTRAFVCDSWQDVYEKSNIFITCTSSLERYIDLPVKSDKLILDVSLRDFKEEALDSFTKPFIDDDWDKDNREKTDNEKYKKDRKMSKDDSITLSDINKMKMNSI